MLLYDFTLPALDGGTIDFSRWRGQPVLIVNTASKCGFTRQYEDLQALWSSYRHELVVVGVPCNQFGNQEPGSSEDIATFCSRNYGVSFPMAARIDVRGPHAHPLFRWLAGEGGFLSRPRWNFYKYFVSREGHLASWFTSLASPDSDRVQMAANRLILDH
ncbi:glutathione peroxidase [Acetobacter sp. AN02]|uniref:glutathione peroxidase n=1 Tax=Acetobacter sp. AN02 TaxID=2894186 RepID=UPI0024342C00|nr:glutathione peroxidase [Acetobacter sp. AN02]